jgi:hypothetical protein
MGVRLTTGTIRRTLIRRTPGFLNRRCEPLFNFRFADGTSCITNGASYLSNLPIPIAYDSAHYRTSAIDPMVTTYKWQFAPRFRRNAFGWNLDTPIQRIKEALTEIKAVAKKEPLLAAEGAVLFLEKLAPAIEAIDSSTGGMGSAVNRHASLKRVF